MDLIYALIILIVVVILVFVLLKVVFAVFGILPMSAVQPHYDVMSLWSLPGLSVQHAPVIQGSL